MVFGQRGIGHTLEVGLRHASIVNVYHSLMEWGDLMAVIESGVGGWIVVYRLDDHWRPIVQAVISFFSGVNDRADCNP